VSLYVLPGRALKTVVQGLLLSNESEKLHSMNLLLYMAPFAVCLLLPASLILEGNVLAKVITKAQEDPSILVLLFANGSLAYLTNLTNFLVTKHTSALTLQVYLGTLLYITALYCTGHPSVQYYTLHRTPAPSHCRYARVQYCTATFAAKCTLYLKELQQPHAACRYAWVQYYTVLYWYAAGRGEHQACIYAFPRLVLQVLGNAKGAVAAVISVLVFQNPVTGLGAFGFFITDLRRGSVWRVEEEVQGNIVHAGAEKYSTVL